MHIRKTSYNRIIKGYLNKNKVQPPQINFNFGQWIIKASKNKRTIQNFENHLKFVKLFPPSKSIIIQTFYTIVGNILIQLTRILLMHPKFEIIIVS